MPQAVHLAQHPTCVPPSATHIPTWCRWHLLVRLPTLSRFPFAPAAASSNVLHGTDHLFVKPSPLDCWLLGAGVGFCSSLWHQRVAQCLAHSRSSEREWAWVSDPGPTLTHSLLCQLGPLLGLSEEFQAVPPDPLPAHSPTLASSSHSMLALPSRSPFLATLFLPAWPSALHPPGLGTLADGL